MKFNLALRIAAFLIIIMIQWSTAQTQYETIFGDLDGPEHMADAKSLANENTVVLGNTTAYGPQKIILAELSEIGEIEWYRTIEDALDSDITLTGKSLALAYDQIGTHIGYYITGCRDAYRSQLIVIRTDLDGTPVWTKSLYNTDRQDTLEECGVSLEIQPGGDIIVVGTSLNYETGNNRFIVARLTSDGLLIWSYRYGSVQGLQFYPIESCNGYRNNVPVIMVVGRMSEEGYGHTFLSCIRAGTGVEIWRRQYHSSGSHDSGNDVVQNPFNQRFMVVGYIDTVGMPTGMWVFNANVLNGTLIDGSVYREPAVSLWATEVCLATPTSSAIIVGRRDSVYLGPHTFALRMPFTIGAAPVWSYYYNYSIPDTDVLGHDAVDGFTSSVPGHYIVGSEGNMGDLYVAKIGTGGDDLCSGVPFQPNVTPMGYSETLNKHRSKADDWIEYTLMTGDEEVVQLICWPEPPEWVEHESEEFFAALSAYVFPNPVYAGDQINIQVELPESSEVNIELLDVNSKSYGSIHEYREAGTHIFSMRIPDASFMQVYFVSVTLANGQQQLIKLVANY